MESNKKLEKVQRQAARFVHNNYHDRTPGCVSKMVSDLGWEPLQKRRQIGRLTTVYKIQRRLVETNTGYIVRTNDRRTRGQQRLSTSCHIDSLQNFLLPKDHQRMEIVANLYHRCCHSRGIPCRFRWYLAGPAAITYYSTDDFNQF